MGVRCPIGNPVAAVVVVTAPRHGPFCTGAQWRTTSGLTIERRVGWRRDGRERRYARPRHVRASHRLPQFIQGIRHFERVESDRRRDDSCRDGDSSIDRLDDETYLTSSNWSARAARQAFLLQRPRFGGRGSDALVTSPGSRLQVALRFWRGWTEAPDERWRGDEAHKLIAVEDWPRFARMIASDLTPRP